MRASILVIGLCGLAGCASPPNKPAPHPEFARALAPVCDVDMPEALARLVRRDPLLEAAALRPYRAALRRLLPGGPADDPLPRSPDPTVILAWIC
jgi:hypothetical protein